MAGKKSDLFSLSALSDQHAKAFATSLGLNPKDRPMIEKIKKNLDKAVQHLIAVSGDYEGVMKELSSQLNSYDRKGFQPKSMDDLRKLQADLAQITDTMSKLAKNKDVSESALAALSPLMVKTANSLTQIKTGQWGNLALMRKMEETGLGSKTDVEGIDKLYKRNSDLLNRDFKKFMRDSSNLLKNSGLQSGMIKTTTAALLGPAGAVLAEPISEMVEEQYQMFKDTRRAEKERKQREIEAIERFKEQQAKEELKRKEDKKHNEEMAENYEKLADQMAGVDENYRKILQKDAAAYRLEADKLSEDSERSADALEAIAYGKPGSFDASGNFMRNAFGDEEPTALGGESELTEKMFKEQKKQTELLRELLAVQSLVPPLITATNAEIAALAAFLGGGGSTMFPPMGPDIGGPDKKKPRPGTSKWEKLKDLAKRGGRAAYQVGRFALSAPALATTAAVASGVGVYQAVTNPGGQNYINDMMPDAVKGTARNMVSNVMGGYQETKDFFGDVTGQNSIGSILQDAAAITGVPYNTLATFASIESGFDPNARNSKSSAGGLFQFIDDTWADMVRKYGAKHGIGIQDKMDPRANAIMGGYFLRENMDYLHKKGIPVDETSLYLAHFMGAGGAASFLKNVYANPQGSAVAAAGQEAASANRSIFYRRDGSERTNAEVMQIMSNKTYKHSQAGSAAMAMSISGGVGPARAGVGETMGAPPSYNTSVGSAAPTSSVNRAAPIAPMAPVSSNTTAPNMQGTSNAKDAGSSVSIDTIPMYVDDTGLILVTMGGMV